MAEISQIKDVVNDITYDIKDAQARADLQTKQDAIENITVDYQEDGGTPNASAEFNNGDLEFTMKNLKMKFSDLSAAEKAELKGEKGEQGDSVIVGEGDLPLANTLGESSEKAITQAAATEYLGTLMSVETEVVDVDISLPLPSEYTQLPYIENTLGAGGAYIDTGIVANDAKWEFEGSYLVKDRGATSQPIFGNYERYKGCYGLARYSTATQGVYFSSCTVMNDSGNRDLSRGLSLNVWYNFKVYVESGVGKLNINGNVTSAGKGVQGTNTTASHILLFGAQSASPRLIGQMGEFKARHDGVLVMSLVPCKKTVEGVEVFGMFDRVSRTFFTSDSETPFTYTETN